MSYFDYKVSQEISERDYPFYSLIMSAMRQADTENAGALRAMWPNVWDELQERYDAPGGRIGGEVGP